jgi:pentatricopeptide repeat protein
MAKSKRTSGRRVGLSPREQGLQAFQSGRFNEALQAWAPLGPSDPAVRRAMAETHFRRALSAAAVDPLADLRRAHELSRDDLRFIFHLGRLLHREGDYAAAEQHYRTVLAREPEHAAAARLLALLQLEQQPRADLRALSAMSPAVEAWLAPAMAVLRGTPAPADESAMGALWRGLSQLAAGDAAAATTLADERSLPSADLHRLRRYYRGLAAAVAGDEEAALKHWTQLFESGARPPGLEEKLAVLIHARLEALVDANNPAAAALAERWATLSGGPAFDELCLLALNQGAQAAAASADWQRAVARWEAARQILSRNQKLGSPRPLLHNLALAYEQLEQWEKAAEAWRAMLRTRKRSASADGQEDQRWAWVRKQIIKCYREAERPDEAVTVFRQMIKLEPNDIELRLELADTLFANEQDRAAQNELKRALEIDPHHPEAVARYALSISERWEFPRAQQLVRDMAAHHAGKPEAQRRAAEIFMHHGNQYSLYGHYQHAYNAFVEGERYDPGNARFPLNQARMLIVGRQQVDPAPLIERALQAQGDQPVIWSLAIETWMMADDMAQARALIERFVQERKPSANDYRHLGLQLLGRAIPPPSSVFLRLGTTPPSINSAWVQLGLEQFERAIALSPSDISLPKQVAGMLILHLPEQALPFIDRVIAQDPDDAYALIMKGMALGLCERVSEAKTVLQQAGQMARKQGRPDLQDQARELRQAVGTPMLRMMVDIAFSVSLDDDMLEDLDDLLDDLY